MENENTPTPKSIGLFTKILIVAVGTLAAAVVLLLFFVFSNRQCGDFLDGIWELDVDRAFYMDFDRSPPPNRVPKNLEGEILSSRTLASMTIEFNGNSFVFTEFIFRSWLPIDSSHRWGLPPSYLRTIADAPVRGGVYSDYESLIHVGYVPNFHHLRGYEIEPCRIYFAVSQGTFSLSEDGRLIEIVFSDGISRVVSFSNCGDDIYWQDAFCSRNLIST